MGGDGARRNRAPVRGAGRRAHHGASHRLDIHSRHHGEADHRSHSGRGEPRRAGCRPAETRSAGLSWFGEFGLPGRRYCWRKDPATGKRAFQLHCYAKGWHEIDRHLAFADYLRAHPAIAKDYEAEKDPRRSAASRQHARLQRRERRTGSSAPKPTRSSGGAWKRPRMCICRRRRFVTILSAKVPQNPTNEANSSSGARSVTSLFTGALSSR